MVVTGNANFILKSFSKTTGHCSLKQMLLKTKANSVFWGTIFSCVYKYILYITKAISAKTITSVHFLHKFIQSIQVKVKPIYYHV